MCCNIKMYISSAFILVTSALHTLGQSVCTGVLLLVRLRSVLKETSGDLLACPFHERPRKCHLAGVNYYQGNGHVTWDQWKPRSPKPVAHLFLCHLFYKVRRTRRPFLRGRVLSLRKQIKWGRSFSVVLIFTS